MIVVFRCPADGESRLHCAIRAQRGEAVHHQAARHAVWALPWVAFDFNAQRAAVVGTRTRTSGQRQRGDQETNCSLP
jgi:hypothetical protein